MDVHFFFSRYSKSECIFYVLTAFIQTVDTIYVIFAHVRGMSKFQIGITLGENGWLAIFGEGIPLAEHSDQSSLTVNFIS